MSLDGGIWTVLSCKVISTMPQDNGYYCQCIYWLVREYVEMMRCKKKKTGYDVYTSLDCLACQNLSRQCGHAQPGIWSIALQYLINKDQTLSEGTINPQSVTLTTTYDKELQWESLEIIYGNHDYGELWYSGYKLSLYDPCDPDWGPAKMHVPSMCKTVVMYSVTVDCVSMIVLCMCSTVDVAVCY